MSIGPRARGFTVCCLTYLAALGAALAAGWSVAGQHPLVVVGVGDLAATAVVFCASVLFDNSSLYDPYWSVAPLFIAPCFWLPEPGGLRAGVVLVLVALWGLRLTHNWARGWRGLSHEDWRYVQIRQRTGRAYWPASFLGIHLMPTIVVFLGCMPLLPAVAAGSVASWLDGVALIVTAMAIWIEATADRQLRRFVLQGHTAGAVLETGLWAYSRHPNYFGEILFWWGLYLFGLAADPARWWTGVGALAITLLFLLISLPLIERRMLERRPTYREARRRRSLLVPWIPLSHPGAPHRGARTGIPRRS